MKLCMPSVMINFLTIHDSRVHYNYSIYKVPFLSCDVFLHYFKIYTYAVMQCLCLTVILLHFLCCIHVLKLFHFLVNLSL